MTRAVGTPSGSGEATAKSRARAQAAGLRLERVWTTEGVHPYDEVTWERRDVVMTNWRDGSVNFEQRGVEFPDFWSINATNIVTSKYFRGAVGTPQRESSLRQIIDRVVRTYRRAGEEHGYFASDRDAEIFEHELIWMLVHQVFSFNSPVWFNVGTPAAQQCSACFILSVDDSMDSILEWYKEEGRIFKGGSGAGVNLSRIRSSKELLSSGGNASGPVSFMRGADASAGTIKSGGATRRAAKMVILDVDHPDIADFIATKAREEDKIRVLRDAGFDMDLGGKDIVSVQYQNANNSVRVSDEFMRAVEEGRTFDLLGRLDGRVIETVDARSLFRSMAQAAWECADPGIQYDDTINDWHTNPESGRITASNPCSEFMSLDNSSCNLASLNLMKFRRADGSFDVQRFVKSVEIVITAMDISICFADFPTEKIAEVTRAYRQLGIGYANLGALLMASGLPYDSDAGRSLAAAITSLMTATAYRRSAELAAVVGSYEGFARNAEAHKRVMRKHAAANDDLKPHALAAPIAREATKQWQLCLKLGERHGYRNAQASLLAPTGCLTGDTLITTDRGLVRLAEIADPYGDRWQDLSLTVATDQGPRRATKFFVNGEEPTRKIVTASGYQIQGTLTHRLRIVEPDGTWVWKRLADLAPGDIVPLQLGPLVGPARRVILPGLDRALGADDCGRHVPEAVDADLAELAGYFLGAGRLVAQGISLRVADPDLDVIDRIRVLSKGSFALEPAVTQQPGYHEVRLESVLLARWWRAAGFAPGGEDHEGPAQSPRVPNAILESNDPEIYAAFLRGLFEAVGSVTAGVPALAPASDTFTNEIRSLLLVLGIATTTSPGQLRVRDGEHTGTFVQVVGFMGQRKNALLSRSAPGPVHRHDRIYLAPLAWRELVPASHPLSAEIARSLAEDGGVSRPVARQIFAETGDARLGQALGYLFEPVAANEDGGIAPTYDLSVPSNVTYVAAGFVSHNTIGLAMDCDTTGIEPDLALVKLKKLVGGGSMQIVNQTVPLALRHLGYQEEQVEAIVEYIAEHGHVVGAPGLRQEHYAVFDCAMGERAIAPMGHLRMMAATQPFLSGSISKTVNMAESATVEDVENIYMQGWKLGLKAIAIYRDNCKVGQPLSNAKAKKKPSEPEKVIEYRPTRRRMPKKRPSETISFTVGGAEGYMTASSYPDDGLGEVFLKMSKQGSTLAGVMDAFSLAISVGLQYGVPLETWVRKFINMRFEPAGMTDDPDIRMATSVVDYIFRRLALDFLPLETRAELGIFTAKERAAQVRAEAAGEEFDLAALAASAPIETNPALTGRSKGAEPGGSKAAGPGEARSSMELLERARNKESDAPLCFSCGTKMRPAGSCYVCEGCGSTSGCS